MKNEKNESAKLLGVTISNNLTWNMHIDQIIKKASIRMYFLIQLKRANVARHELILFHTSCIRSVRTYASPAFLYVLPLYLKEDLENVEKRALSIICPVPTYREALELSNIMSINYYMASLCKKTFLSIANGLAHRLHNMLQSSGPSCYNLRCKRRLAIPKGAIHSTKIPTGPTGKIGPPQKVDPFFRNFSGWTEPIH